MHEKIMKSSDANRSPLFNLFFTLQREEVQPKGLRGQLACGSRTGTWLTRLSVTVVTCFGHCCEYSDLLSRRLHFLAEVLGSKLSLNPQSRQTQRRRNLPHGAPRTKVTFGIFLPEVYTEGRNGREQRCWEQVYGMLLALKKCDSAKIILGFQSIAHQH